MHLASQEYQRAFKADYVLICSSQRSTEVPEYRCYCKEGGDRGGSGVMVKVE